MATDSYSFPVMIDGVSSDDEVTTAAPGVDRLTQCIRKIPSGNTYFHGARSFVAERECRDRLYEYPCITRILLSSGLLSLGPMLFDVW
ncbi:unnamed protein product [Macrosiphum euphorbiae]|uniref:Uncharacterized protein n=1 Tax=Macrosiphum euphorbiae TaxID=13131 RepID=A0AAV0VPK0_9HEMI|nr:unnamed protein product [Macrosiphum euphorbiae]